MAALKQDERSLPGGVVSPDSELFNQSLNKYRHFVKRNSTWIAGKNKRLLVKIRRHLLARCRRDQLPDVAQVLLGGKDVSQTDSPDSATVQLFTRIFHPPNSSLVKIQPKGSVLRRLCG